MSLNVDIHQYRLPFDNAVSVDQDFLRGTHILTAPRLEPLFDHLAGRLKSDPLPPYEFEVVLLPHGSALRPWLNQKLASRLGCAASLYTPTIREYADSLIRRLLNADPSAFDRATLTWRIFGLLKDLPDTAGDLAPLRDYLRRTEGSAMPLARRLAQLFDSYQTFRPDLLRLWTKRGAAAGVAAWQAQLWQDIAPGPSDLEVDRSGLMQGLVNHLSKDAPDGLPRRISILGEAVVPPVYLKFLNALSRHVGIVWYAIAASGGNFSHPLAEIFGEDDRQAMRLRAEHLKEARVVRLSDRNPPDPSMGALAVLQRDIREGHRRRSESRVALPPEDASLRIHDCHSPIRELEVLRDQLLDAFESLDDLRPSDVLVVVPDLDRYAALVEAVFSAGDEKQRLKCAVARDPREDGRRYLTAFLSLLETLGSRLTAGSILELLSEPAIGRKAQLDAEAVEIIRGWIRATHVRWGADGRHRQAFDLPPDDLHTWRYGLDRLLMGFVAGEADDPVDGVLPYAEATLGRAPILGRFAAWMQTLTDAAREVRRTRTLDEWRTWLELLVRRLMTAEADDEEMAEDYLLGQLREMTQLLPDMDVDFASLRSHLSYALDSFEGRGKLLSGAITVADFERLRYVPARVIACVGLNDDAFPRGNAAADFDLINADRGDGDPDPRRLDKQLFLDVLLSAQDRLILTYNGRSQKDNSERAPSIVIDALLDACASTFTAGEHEPSSDAGRVRDHFLVQHPLQPFSPRYFDGSDRRLFSYDRTNCIPPPADLEGIAAFASQPLTAAESDDAVLALDDLIAAWSNPGKFFCEKLGLRLKLSDLTVEDIEPQFLDGLASYQISQQMLELFLEGEPEERVRTRLRMEGSLPAGELGRLVFEKYREDVDSLLQRVQQFGAPSPAEIDLQIAGRRLVGSVPYVTAEASLHFRPAKLKARDRITVWIHHLALAASGQERATWLFSKDRPHVIKHVADPLQFLEPLVAGINRIMQEPLLILPESSYAYSMNGSISTAVSKYESSPWSRGDCDNEYIATLNRHHHPIRDRLKDFAHEAEALWAPINEHLKKA